MGNRAVRVAEILDQLESHYGKQSPTWPTDPYEFLIWWHCGYPASDKTCAKGWNALHKVTSIAPQEILNAGVEKLTGALKAGGMVPELRALRLTEIAMRVQNEFAGDLRTGLTGSIQKVRAILKKFPNIADPGADRILRPVPALRLEPSVHDGAGERIEHLGQRAERPVEMQDECVSVDLFEFLDRRERGSVRRQ